MAATPGVNVSALHGGPAQHVATNAEVFNAAQFRRSDLTALNFDLPPVRYCSSFRRSIYCARIRTSTGSASSGSRVRVCCASVQTAAPAKSHSFAAKGSVAGSEAPTRVTFSSDVWQRCRNFLVSIVFLRVAVFLFFPGGVYAVLPGS